ncbi:MAG: hypothetical protein DWQ07_20255 [Chloroflexi bacterium]|nr:MAG: hypothetical protein DWQ07_20255 [Chloroflexota bacterium]MBL1194415.1 hypothetical protein [Chloroflexota bacterium]NOH11703.1 hypothetical protein [Chloroflexota bacterium]
MFKHRLPIIAVLLLACGAFPPFANEAQPKTGSVGRQVTNAITTQQPATQSPQTDAQQPDENPSAFEVRLHPEDGIYVGELVSFEVLAPEDLDLSGEEIKIEVNGLVIGPAQFHRFGIGGRSQATFLWEWDTTSFDAGIHELTFQVLPDGDSWMETVTLLPLEEMPLDSANADWTQIRTDCCIVYYVTGTEAERDIAELSSQIDLQADRAEEAMDTELEAPIPFVLMPRLLGHGGFASNEIYISYLDRNYAGENTTQVFHHEIVHVIDARLGGELRPSMLVEGLAVYLSDGHFKVEPLMERAVALLELDWYIPYETLADGFYFHQHEIGYIQASALTEYMVERWGWEAYNNFYRDIKHHPSDSDYQAIDAGVRRHFDISFAELEEDFLAVLRSLPVDPDLVADVRLTVSFFDTVRRYQQVFDPSAYFLTAWLLNIEEMQEFDVTADYLRHPDEAANLALETMLVSADENLRAGRYGESERLLNAANAVLDVHESGLLQIFNAHPLAGNYYQLVLTLLDNGYEPHEISISRNTAQVLVSRDGVELIGLSMSLNGESWSFD